jgi:hypothetical protein
VIPIFKQQIAAGGPVTVTHPDMQRYFMTIPEASQLVLQAGAMGSGGEIFILDMGEPVKIVDLARDLITLSGFRPGVDIEIKFNGIRPGEKLFEQLATDAEHADKTKHPKIFIGRIASPSWADVSRGLDELVGLVDDGDAGRIRVALRTLVPEYTGGLAVVPAPAPATHGGALGSQRLPTTIGGLAELSSRVALDRRAELPAPASDGRSESSETAELAKPRRGDSTGSHPALAVPG